jgi:hypothetical protein
MLEYWIVGVKMNSEVGMRPSTSSDEAKSELQSVGQRAWSDGVVEWWSDGVLEYWIIAFGGMKSAIIST